MGPVGGSDNCGNTYPEAIGIAGNGLAGRVTVTGSDGASVPFGHRESDNIVVSIGPAESERTLQRPHQTLFAQGNQL